MSHSSRREELNGLLRKYSWLNLVSWDDRMADVNGKKVYYCTLQIQHGLPWGAWIWNCNHGHSTKKGAHEDVSAQAVAYIRQLERTQQV